MLEAHLCQTIVYDDGLLKAKTGARTPLLNRRGIDRKRKRIRERKRKKERERGREGKQSAKTRDKNINELKHELLA